uniref:hypothetical protein n=1 Tax=Cellulomonas iranensis TaxID=76862 RepID=UPI001177D575
MWFQATFQTESPHAGPLIQGCRETGCPIHVRFTEVGVTTKWQPQGPVRDQHGRKVAELLPAQSVTKYASTAALSGTRKGTRTTLVAPAAYYSAKSNRFVRSHNRLLLQYQD